VSTHLALALGNPHELGIAVDAYLSDLESKIGELERLARPLGEEISEVTSKIKRANKLFIDGNLSETEYQDHKTPLMEKLASLQADESSYGPRIEQFQFLHQRRSSIRRAIKDGSLVSSVSHLRGLNFREARSDSERFELIINSPNRSYGIEAINNRLYKSDLGGMDFKKTLDFLQLKVLVYADKVTIDGLISIDIPNFGSEDEISGNNQSRGASMNNRSQMTVLPSSLKVPFTADIPLAIF